jgi:hypothetical protein
MVEIASAGKNDVRIDGDVGRPEVASSVTFLLADF